MSKVDNEFNKDKCDMEKECLPKSDSKFKSFLKEFGDALIGEVLGSLLFILPPIVLIYCAWVFISAGIGLLLIPLAMLMWLTYKRFR